MIKLNDLMPKLELSNKKLQKLVKVLELSLKQEFPQIQDLDLYIKPNKTLYIQYLRIKKEFRRQGIGRELLYRIKKFGDKYNLTISFAVEAEPRYKKKLDAFYKSSGFILNKGKNIDYTLSEPFSKTMYRRPNTN